MPTRISRIRRGMVNCYLLQGDGGSILVDAANAKDGPAIAAALQKLGTAPETLCLVLLTHGHPDHAGAAGWLHREYGVPVALHPADTEGGADPGARGTFGKLLRAASRRPIQNSAPEQAQIPLHNGIRLDSCGIAAAVLATPGHTAGSVCVVTDDGHCLCGDVFMNFYAPRPAFIAEDFAGLQASIDLLAQCDIETLWPGHGGPFPFKKLQKMPRIG